MSYRKSGKIIHSLSRPIVCSCKYIHSCADFINAHIYSILFCKWDKEKNYCSFKNYKFVHTMVGVLQGEITGLCTISIVWKIYLSSITKKIPTACIRVYGYTNIFFCRFNKGEQLIKLSLCFLGWHNMSVTGVNLKSKELAPRGRNSSLKSRPH